MSGIVQLFPVNGVTTAAPTISTPGSALTAVNVRS
jgi:hypothetical protein